MQQLSNHYFSIPFRSLFVANSLDGLEDYLVSGKLFKLISDSMVSFLKMLTESQVLISLLAVLREIIPPKRIKRKNREGYELLDFF